MNRMFFKILRFMIICAGIQILMVWQLSGQFSVDSLKNPNQYLFPDFTTARVATKVGKDLYLMANYNIVTEVIVFHQRGQIYDLADYHNVDTIYFKDNTFIPGEKLFYEVSVSGPVSLLIRHRGSILPPPKPAAYGGTSEVSSSTYVNYVQMNGGNAYRLKNETSLIIRPSDEYYIRMGESISPFNSKKKFISLFPEIETELNAYLKKNKVRFDNKDDVTELVKYCNSLRGER